MPNTCEVAAGVVNLGNTCYMNAVLQALAHAPELCLAIECESHYKTCPIALKNSERRRKNESEKGESNKEETGTKVSVEIDHDHAVTLPTRPTRSTKSKNSRITRNTRRSPSRNSVAIKSSKKILNNGDEFCSLCEVEKHLIRVHSDGAFDIDLSDPILCCDSPGSGEAVAPSIFVHGFIEHVAPWFKLGKQEDSHEFLRLLIDAMQNSCITASKDKSTFIRNNLGCDNEFSKKENLRNEGDGTTEIDNQVVDTKSQMKETHEVAKIEPNNESERKGVPGHENDIKEDPDNENRSETSKPSKHEEYAFRLFRGTVESIVKCSSCEAISSKVDPIEDIGLDVSPAPSGGSTMSPKLSDVISALDKFTAMENLDSGYKCEKCGKIGRATKQSRFVSIPPILTLHLKRFRYGSNGKKGKSFPSSRRRNSELSSLLGGANGTSGSAKIEGHVKFELVFDIRPYLTEEKKKEIKRMFCRLFAVIVHAGKNSHSGHYIAYVRNVAKNEWWKMDDARVSRVSNDEVVAAEAYMLFYRVVDHPVAIRLRKTDEAAKVALKATKLKDENGQNSTPPGQGMIEKRTSETMASDTKRRRIEPRFKSGEEWAKAITNLPKSCIPIFRRAEDFLSEHLEFKHEYFRLISGEADDGGKIHAGPTVGVSADDVQGDSIYREAICELLSKIISQNDSDASKLFKVEGNGTLNSIDDEKKKSSNSSSPLIIPVVDPNDTLI